MTDGGGGRRTVLRLVLGWALLLLAGYAVGILIRDAHPAWDAAAVRALRGSDRGALTDVMRAVTSLGPSLWLDAVFFAAVTGLLVRRRLRDLRFLLLASPGAVALELILKAAVNRPRPPGHHLVAAGSPSWPSGHAASSLALYGALLVLALAHSQRRTAGARWVRRAAIALTAVLVALIGVSRVYLAVHYPTDVVAGWLLAGSWLAIVLWSGAGPQSQMQTEPEWAHSVA